MEVTKAGETLVELPTSVLEVETERLVGGDVTPKDSAEDCAGVKKGDSTGTTEVGVDVRLFPAAFQINSHDVTDKSGGTSSQNRSSPSVRTAKPGSLASAWTTSCQRKLAARALIEKAWT